jgi:hypothetical protein
MQMTFTLEEAEEMACALRALPAMDASKQRLTKQGVVKHLAGEIAALQQRGYTIEQIVESLRGIGLEISTPTLKSYLQRAKRKPARGASHRSKQATAPTPAGTRPAQPGAPSVSDPKPDGVGERSGKQAFLLKDKDSY